MGNCTTSPINDNNDNNTNYTDTQHYKSVQDDTWLEGEWTSTKDCCGFGYKGVWEISVDHDEIFLEEQYASCCVCVPNPCIKRGCMMHRMVKVAQNEWRGTLGCKPISLTVVSPSQLSHLTTDGYFTLTRDTTTTTTTHDMLTTEKHATLKTEKGILLPPAYTPEDIDIVEGVWKVTRDIDLGGHYEAEWEILADGDGTITITQQRGTCCWKLCPDTVFNRCGRPIHMKCCGVRTLSKVAPGRWIGHFGCQTLTLTIVSENELRHSLGFPEGSYTLTR